MKTWWLSVKQFSMRFSYDVKKQQTIYPEFGSAFSGPSVARSRPPKRQLTNQQGL